MHWRAVRKPWADMWLRGEADMQSVTSTITGKSLIGFREGTAAGEVFQAINPVTGTKLQPDFYSALQEEIELAARLAEEAFESYRQTSGRERGRLLRTIAAKLESNASNVVERANRETALQQ